MACQAAACSTACHMGTGSNLAVPLGKQQNFAQVLGSLQPHGRPGSSSWLQTSPPVATAAIWETKGIRGAHPKMEGSLSNSASPMKELVIQDNQTLSKKQSLYLCNCLAICKFLMASNQTWGWTSTAFNLWLSSPKPGPTCWKIIPFMIVLRIFKKVCKIHNSILEFYEVEFFGFQLGMAPVFLCLI